MEPWHNIDVKCIKNYNSYIKNHRKRGKSEEGSYQIQELDDL